MKALQRKKILRKCSYLKERLSENEIQCHYFFISGGSDQRSDNEYFPFYVKRGLYSKVSGKNSTVSFEYEKNLGILCHSLWINYRGVRLCGEEIKPLSQFF